MHCQFALIVHFRKYQIYATRTGCDRSKYPPDLDSLMMITTRCHIHTQNTFVTIYAYCGLHEVPTVLIKINLD